jgi:acyl-CoA thioesterase-1
MPPKALALCVSMMLAAVASAQTTHPAATTRSSAMVRIACCGDSITRKPMKAPYSRHLGKMLGDGFDVRNFGHDGVTALRDSGRPYSKVPEFEAANVFEPDIVILMLGTNDAASTPDRRAKFADDFLWFVRHFQSLPSRPQVIVMTPPPLMPGREDDRMNALRDEISPSVRRIAAEEKLVLVDLQQERALADPALYPDKVHPDEAGAKIIAQRVFDVLRSQRTTGAATSRPK